MVDTENATTMLPAVPAAGAPVQPPPSTGVEMFESGEAGAGVGPVTYWDQFKAKSAMELSDMAFGGSQSDGPWMRQMLAWSLEMDAKAAGEKKISPEEGEKLYGVKLKDPEYPKIYELTADTVKRRMGWQDYVNRGGAETGIRGFVMNWGSGFFAGIQNPLNFIMGKTFSSAMAKLGIGESLVSVLASNFAQNLIQEGFTKTQREREMEEVTLADITRGSFYGAVAGTTLHYGAKGLARVVSSATEKVKGKVSGGKPSGDTPPGGKSKSLELPQEKGFIQAAKLRLGLAKAANNQKVDLSALDKITEKMTKSAPKSPDAPAAPVPPSEANVLYRAVDPDGLHKPDYGYGDVTGGDLSNRFISAKDVAHKFGDVEKIDIGEAKLIKLNQSGTSMEGARIREIAEKALGHKISMINGDTIGNMFDYLGLEDDIDGVSAKQVVAKALKEAGYDGIEAVRSPTTDDGGHRMVEMFDSEKAKVVGSEQQPVELSSNRIAEDLGKELDEDSPDKMIWHTKEVADLVEDFEKNPSRVIEPPARPLVVDAEKEILQKLENHPEGEAIRAEFDKIKNSKENAKALADIKDKFMRCLEGTFT